jgi:hypothetical protein
MSVSRSLEAPVLGFVTVLLWGLGCGGDSREVATVELRDSAGVEVILNVGPITHVPAIWAVGSGPILSIGSAEGDDAYQLLGVAGAYRLSDGRIGVVNAGSRDVRFYSAEGVHLATMGKRGGGPEEFEMPALAGSIGDTLIVVDRAHHRLTFVHPDAGFVRLARVSDEVGGFLNPLGSLAGGRSVFGGAFDTRRIGELHNGMNRAHTYYRSCNPDGSLAADFGDKPGAEFFIGKLEGGGPDSRPALIPFGRMPVATASSSHLYFGDQDEWEVEVHAANGSLVRLIRQEWEPIPIEKADAARYIEEVAGRLGNPERATRMREYLSRLPVPEHFPPFGALLADRLGYLWVEDYQRPGADAAAWTVFDPKGVRTARLSLPPRFSPIEIGPDYILGLGWDEWRVEYIRLYALDRSIGG